MGVPGLFRYFCRRIPNAVVSAVPEEVDELYIDYNGVVHGAVSYLIAHELDVTDNSVIQTSLEYIENVMARFRPKSLVYIAIDGVPPRAKMLQQRWRRFKHELSTRHLSGAWDTNVISPGTDFMARLEAALFDWAGGAAAAAGVKRVVDPSTVEGEGEQKLLVAMREHHIPDGRVVVCGMDADLTLMAMTELQSPLRPYAGMYILREQESASTEASIINVDTLLRGVVNNLMQSTDTSVVCDFVALVALAGNDFVPALPGIVIHRGGIDHLVRLYHEERQGGGTERLWGSEGGAAYLGGLNLAFLRRILQRAARTEGIALSKQDSLQRYEIRPLEPAWRARYYVAEFGSFESEFVLRISRQYVAMVAWSAVYLIRKQCLSIGAICTNGHAAPLALDVANSIDDKIDEYCRKF